MPPFLVRLLTPEAYGAWALALQIATYVGLFGFGIQVAVGRYVAYCDARGDRPQRDGIVATAFWFLAAVAILAFVGVVVAAGLLERIVPDLSPGLVGQTQQALVLVGLSLAVNLPASVFAAVFIGMQRSDVAAKIQGGGRLVLAAGLILASFSRDLGMLGIVYVIVSLGTVAVLWKAWRDHTPEPQLSARLVSATHGRELASFCFSLTIWNVAMLMIGGLDVILVGRYDYPSVAFFALAMTLMNLIIGTIASFANALVPVAASDSRDSAVLRDLLGRGSRLTVGISLIATAPLVFSGNAVLSMWVGQAYANQTTGILMFLAVAAFIRNGLLAYVMVAIGTGLQRRMTITPLIEGAASILLSLFLVRLYGAIGVAAAKVFSGLIGVILIVFQHALRDTLGGLSRKDIIANCILKPGVAIIPIIAAGILVYELQYLSLWAAPVTLTAISIICVYLFTLNKDDRSFLNLFIDRTVGRFNKSLGLRQ